VIDCRAVIVIDGDSLLVGLSVGLVARGDQHGTEEKGETDAS